MNKNISLNKFKEVFNKTSYFDDPAVCLYRGCVGEDGIIREDEFMGARINTASSLIAVIDILESKTILEIGTWKGRTSMAVANYFEKKYNDMTGLVVDTFDIKRGGYDGGEFLAGSPLVNFHFWMPHHSPYDDWKYKDSSIVYSEFKDLSNEDIYSKNLKYLNLIKPKAGYDLVFIDGDHSVVGAGYDHRYAMEVLGKNGVVVFDDCWGHGAVTKYFNSIENVEKWDFLESNQTHFKEQNFLHNFGIVFNRD